MIVARQWMDTSGWYERKTCESGAWCIALVRSAWLRTLRAPIRTRSPSNPGVPFKGVYEDYYKGYYGA